MLVVAFAAFPNYVGGLLGGDEEPPPMPAISTATRMFRISGMTCAGCVETVRSAIGKVSGVASVEVSYDEQLAKVEVTDRAREHSIVAAVQELGFEVTPVPESQVWSHQGERNAIP